MSAPATTTEAPEQVSTPVQPKEQRDLAVAVLSAVTDPFNSSGGPGVPAESPTVWVALAAARREVETLLSGAKPEDSGTPVSTAQAATAVNAPPVVGAPTSSAADPTTGAVTGKVVATDPEGKKLSYAVVAPPAEGKLVLDNKTGAFTFTPTAAQRLIAGLGGAGFVEFGVTVSDGVKANNQVATLHVTIAPTPITDSGVLATGKNVTGVVATDTRAYLTNYDDKTITVVDTIHRAVLGTIQLEAEPISAVLAPDGKKLYVSLDYTDHVAVIDTTTGAVASTFDLKERYPVSVAVSPNGKTLYVTTLTYDKNGNQVASVTKVSTASGKVTGTVKLPGAIPTFYDIEVAADGKKVYVIADMPTDDPDVVLSGLYVFSSSSSSAKVIAAGTYFTDVELSPDGTRAYLNEVGEGTISGIDTKTYKVVGTIDTYAETLGGLAINGDGSVLLAVDTVNNTVVAIDTRTAAVLTTTPVTATTTDFYPRAVLSPDGMELYYYGDDDQLQIISLVPHNDFPVAHAPVVNAPNANGVVTGHLTVTDSNGDPLTFSAVPAKGSIVFNADGSFTYTPTAAARHAAATGLAGTTTETFLVTISDGRRGVLTQDLTVDIAPLNIDPTAKSKVGKPSSSGVVKGTVTGSDKDKDVLTYTASDPAKGDVTIDAKGRFVFTPTDAARHAASALGATDSDKNETFTVTVNDGHGGTYDVPVTVKISAKNAKPTSPAAIDVVTKSDTGRITGKLGASDLDGDAVTIAKAVATKKATVRVNADGSFTYTPTAAARQAASAPGASSSAKTDTITFTISDGHGGTATLKLKVDIAPASVGNHIPAPGKYTTTTDSSSGVVTGQVTATDSDGDALTYRIDEVVDSALGTVVLNPATGVFAFTPSAQARYEAALGVGPRAAQFTITPFDGKDGAPVDVSVVIVPRHPDDDGSVSLVDLEDLVGAGLVQVGENEDGSVRYIDGAFSDDAVRSIADAAAVLNKVAELLGAPAGSVRAEQIIRQAVMDTRGEVAETFYRVSPTVNAIPVLGAQSVLVVDRDGAVTSLLSDYDPRLNNVDVTPAAGISQASQAVSIAKAALLEGLQLTDQAEITALLATLSFRSNLAVYALDRDSAPRLVWDVEVLSTLDQANQIPDVDQGLPVIGARYYVYANGGGAGTVLATSAGILDAYAPATQSAKDLKNKTRTFTVDRDGSAYRLVDADRNIWVFNATGYTVSDEFHLNSYPGSLIYKTSNGWDRSGVSAIANMEAVYGYYSDVLGRDSIDGLGAPILVSLVGSNYANASWYLQGTYGSFRFGSDFEAALDVVAHEYTHAVITHVIGQGRTYGLDGATESLALNEAYADIIASLIEAKVQRKTEPERWLIGEDLNCGSGGRNACAGRSLADPSLYGGRTRMADVARDDDAHAVAGVFDKAAYLMMNDPTTRAVSDDTWAKVFYNSLYRLGQGARFIDARAAVLSSAKSLGLTNSELIAIQDAFDEVGITESRKVRIVLRWGSSPNDLDSHLTGPTTTGGRFHVYYGNQSYVVNGKSYVDLDYDDTSAYGPEATTIRDFLPGEYYFYVYNFSSGGSTNSTVLSKSGATVMVYSSSARINMIFNVDPAMPGTYWTVFKMTVAESGNITIIPINNYGYSVGAV
ncbi:YVTN family beta-propeller protein/VCBS repeat-containing protein [Mycolicibacterium fluoranthenivorans]|uniref:YVTN family beta-propeller protein/VCBS repeat-containing protein n=1 Tax=Mycolicibacterium fluoranthenivorans TaxID=258505 RepID=A0A7X5U5R4_9MYCO|nr:YVTN family beta-propeller protein/VCBS repeat-containing protein [Mycolicibacterium fluoranthenivorans]